MTLQVNVNRNELFSALSIISSITGKKGTISILSNVLVETSSDNLIITATDLEIGMKILIAAEVISAGSTTIPAKKMLEIVRESSTTNILISESDNNWVQIEAGSGKYNIACLSSHDYPAFPKYEDDGFISIPAKTINEIIGKTIFSVANEGESQFNLTGALFQVDIRNENNIIRMVSSDGHRLSLFELPVEEDISTLDIGKKSIIPKKGLQELRKISDTTSKLKIKIEDKQLIAKVDSLLLIIKLFHGDFPDYTKIVSLIDNNVFIEANRNDIIASMKRINLFTEDHFHVVNFSINKSRIELSSQSADLGNAKDEFPVLYNGNEMSIFFNGRYFIDCLQSLTAEKIKLHISSENSPCFIKSDEEPGFIGVIMPMKI